MFDLDKIVSTKFAKSGSPAYELVKNFTWTNDDQNTVARYIALGTMTPEAAAKKWIEANPEKVKAWLGQRSAVLRDAHMAMRSEGDENGIGRIQRARTGDRSCADGSLTREHPCSSTPSSTNRLTR